MDGSTGDGLVDSAQIRTFDLNARNYKKVDTLEGLVTQSVKKVVFALVSGEL